MQIPGGELDECRVLQGVMVNKDVTHPKMRRHIRNPRIILLDCPLEYKKAESQTTLEILKEEDWNAILKQEEEYIEKMCAEIVALKPDIVITEKGVSGKKTIVCCAVFVHRVAVWLLLKFYLGCC